MPIYVYQVIPEDGDDPSEQVTFEIRQAMSDPPLELHPLSGKPVRRIPAAPAIAVNKLGNSALNSAGFTKYVKTSDGSYERQAGSAGPKHVNPRDYGE